MDDSPVRRLVTQCSKSNDIDAKVDAITKLQAEFETGSEIPEPDALIQVLKACLRTPNQHLTTATLSAIPPCIPLLVTRSPAQIPLPSSSTSPATSTSSAASSPIDAYALRQVITQLMPAGGGVLDRLGDSRERARDRARESLVVMGGFAFRAGGSGSQMNRSREGKGPETPLQLFERFLREGGLASKVWRVREQSILTLVHVRRTHHLFPIRAYLPHLVDALEDTDGAVRECARQSVVELFTGPGVTDLARADLKKEMAKKNVRKTIVDSVLSKVLSGNPGASTPASMSEAGSENGDLAAGTAKEYVPPSITLMGRKPGATAAGGAVSRAVSYGNVREIPRPASRAAAMSPTGEGSSTAGTSSDVKPVYIASSRDLENEFASMLRPFEGKETEHNWAAREQAIQRVRGMLKGEVYERYTETFLHGLKNGFMEASLKTLTSLRTTVATNTCALYSELSSALGTALDPFCDLMYTNLLRLASLTKKIAAQTSQATVTTLLQRTSALPKLIIPLLWNTLQDKAIQTRNYAIGHVKTYLEVHGARATHAIEVTGGIDLLEKIVKKALGDANAGVRDNARKLFWTFQGIWPERGGAILQSLDSVSRKQLEKLCPNPDALASIPITASPKAKKSSVAAAIAASRAKAKAIASAPPTLRHQATSTSHTIRATSPPTKRAVSPALSTSSSTGAIRTTSPIPRSSPPRSRILSGGTLSRSTSSNAVSTTTTTTARGPPRQAQSASSPSPTPDQTYSRRLMSPHTSLNPSPPTSNSTFRKAVETALPASPSSSVIGFASPSPRPQKAGQAAAVPVFRESLSIAGLHQLAGSEEESLLLATNIPVPEDSDSDMEMDESVNLISFSTPYEVYPPAPRSNSRADSFSPVSTGSKPAFNNTLSTGTNSPPAGVAQPLVEDAMRARAEQAESAAERLLELVEPEEDGAQGSPLPAALLLRSREGQGGKPKSRVSSGGSTVPTLPKTPITKRSAVIMQQAALFQDSPAYNGKTASLFAMVDGRDSAGQWWAKRMALLKMPTVHEDNGTPDREETLKTYIAALEQGSADGPMLKKLARLCTQNPVREPLSPISPAFSAPLTPSPLDGYARQLPTTKSEWWTQDRLFDQLFNALVRFLDPRKNAEELEYGLIVLWEMLENQAPLLEGHEADIFGVLLQIRYCAQINVMQATNLFRDTLTSRIEPVYGLTTLHASLRTFRHAPLPPSATTEIRDGTYAFGLIALGKFFLRLPPEVLEEELPRLRSTLISALTESSGTSALAVREAATAATIGAQMILRDETHLFTLLDGLPDEKKNLLTYMFDKHGARGPTNGAGPSAAMDKLEREMRRIDGRLSTPRRI